MAGNDLFVVEVGDARTSMAGRLLADLGVEVLRIEPETSRSVTFGPFSPSGVSLYNAFYNRNKQIIRPADPAAAITEAIGQRPDKRPVIIVAPEDFPAGNAPRGHDLARQFPTALVAELLDYGVYRGPRRYVNVSLAARGGQMAVCGFEHRAPLAAPGHQPVNLAGLYTAHTLLAGHLRPSEQGMLAQVSLQAATAGALENPIAAYFHNGEVHRRQGYYHWSRNSFIATTADGYLLTFLSLDWDVFLAWLAAEGVQNTLDGEIYNTTIARRQYNTIREVHTQLVDWFATKSTAEVLEEALARRFPWSEIAHMPDTIRGDHLHVRGFVSDTGSADIPVTVNSPLRWGSVAHPEGSTAPLLATGTPADDAPPARDPIPDVTADPALPLSGVTILDFTWVVAGPFATRILADLGATVLKVQRPEPEGSPGNANRAPHFRAWNRNKIGLALDVNTPEGHAQALDLIKQADVVIDNFSARVMPNWGFGYEQLLEINPRIVAVGLSGFGRYGPWRDRVSYGPTLQAVSGVTEIMAEPGDPPTGFGFSYADHVGGTVAAYAVLSGLSARKRTGKGLWIDLSQLDGLVYLHGPHALASVSDPAFGPRGNQDWHDTESFTLLIPCKDDDWIAATVFDDTGLRTVLDTLAATDLIPDATLSAGRTQRAEVEEALKATAATRLRAATLATLRARGVEAQPIQYAYDLAADPDLLGCDFFWSVASPETRYTTDGLPVRFTPPLPLPKQAAPLIGEHQHLLARLLSGAPAPV